MAPVGLRPRHPDDVDPLLVVLRRTHEQQGYPVREAAVSAWWLASGDELGSWVAEHDGRVVGHVALHPADDVVALPGWRRATGCEPQGLAVVSRLFTDGSVRGAGSALLQHAQQEAAARGRAPVLQVDPDAAARAFYLRHGWQEVGTARQQWGHRTVDAVLMVAGARTVRP